LFAENRSPQTIERVYVPRLNAFDSWLGAAGMPRTIEGIRREHIESYVLYLQRDAPGRKQTERPGQQPATVSIAFRTLRAFFRWCVEEDLLPRSPMEKMRGPSVPEEPAAILRAEEMERLLKVCAGTTFEDRRDTALLLVLFDTGARRGEVAALRTDDLDWNTNTIHVAAESSKSKRGRAAPFGRKTARAMDRYLRSRSRHPYAEQPWLWLGKRGRLADSGILQMVARRGDQAGLPGLHPHRFRHSFAHQLKAAGMATEQVMALGGWRDPGTLARYGRGAAAERALAAYAHVAPGDKLR
jgi:site-specific recombinase XerD